MLSEMAQEKLGETVASFMRTPGREKFRRLILIPHYCQRQTTAILHRHSDLLEDPTTILNDTWITSLCIVVEITY